MGIRGCQTCIEHNWPIIKEFLSAKSKRSYLRSECISRNNVVSIEIWLKLFYMWPWCVSEPCNNHVSPLPLTGVRRYCFFHEFICLYHCINNIISANVFRFILFARLSTEWIEIGVTLRGFYENSIQGFLSKVFVAALKHSTSIAPRNFTPFMQKRFCKIDLMHSIDRACYTIHAHLSLPSS